MGRPVFGKIEALYIGMLVMWILRKWKVDISGWMWVIIATVDVILSWLYFRIDFIVVQIAVIFSPVLTVIVTYALWWAIDYLIKTMPLKTVIKAMIVYAGYRSALSVILGGCAWVTMLWFVIGILGVWLYKRLVIGKGDSASNDVVSDVEM
ncbi:MAG: hypothetical protein GXO59_07165 [Dictyoglomi bacterium]|nr:hypothetical protein [Dictyoglomota bacterium]